MPKPSIGRIVHYQSFGTPGGEYKPECRAAVVTKVWDPPHPDDPEIVELFVMNPSGVFFNRCTYHGGDVGHDHEGNEIPARSYPGGSWHWPERIED